MVEIERRADQSAAHMVGTTEAVVASLRKLSGTVSAPAPRTWHGFRLAAIEERCQALLREWPTAPARLSPWILPSTAIGLGVILFLTVA